MNKNLNIFILSVFCVLLFLGCKKHSKQESLFEQAQKIYNNDGWDTFIEYVNNHGYFAVMDEFEQGATPLLIAVKNGNLEAINFFIEHGASFFETDENQHDIIDYLLDNFDRTVADRIINMLPKEYWSNIDDFGKTPIVKIICRCTDFTVIQRIILSLEYIDIFNTVDIYDASGKTLLMYASQFNPDVRVINFLLDNGANINAKNNNEWSSLMYAARYNPNPAVLEYLILRGADMKANSVGLTLTMLASCNVNSEVLRSVIKFVPEVNDITKKGKTALMYACANKQPAAVIKILLEHNADANIKDESGKTALMYALENYTESEVPYVLLSAGAYSDAADNTGKIPQDYLDANPYLKNTDLKKDIKPRQTELRVPEDNKAPTQETSEQNNDEVSER